MVQTYSADTSVPLPFHVLAPAYFLRYPNPYAQHVLSVDVIERSIVERGGANANAIAGSSTTSMSLPSRPVLLTARILLKKGTLPSWAPRGLIKNAESWVLEVSEVDLEAGPVGHSKNSSRMNTASPFAGMFAASSDTSGKQAVDDASVGRQMRTWTRNLDHTTVLAVAEGLTFTELIKRTEGGGSEEVSTTRAPKGKSNSNASPALRSPPPSSVHCLTSAHITSDVSVLWSRIEKFGLKRFKAHMDTSRQGLLWSAAGVSNQLYPHDARPPVQTPLTKLRESLRPPWLDGMPLGPIQSMRHRGRLLREQLHERWRLARDEGIWIGGQGRKTREESMERWRDAFRERLVRLRGRVGAGEDITQSNEVESSAKAAQDTPSVAELPRDRMARLAEESAMSNDTRSEQSSSSRWWWQR